MEVAFCLNLLAQSCSEEGPEYFDKTVKALRESADPDTLFVFIQGLKNPAAGIKRLIRSLLAQPEVSGALRFNPNGVTLDKTLVPDLSKIEDADLKSVIDDFFAPDEDQRRVLQTLKGIPLPAGFDKDTLLKEIAAHGSVPLFEPVEVSCTPAFPPSLHVFLEPSSRGSAAPEIRVTVQFFEQKTGAPHHHLIKGRVEKGSAKTSYNNPDLNAIFEDIAIYAIHKYYVRQPEDRAADGFKDRLSSLGKAPDQAPDESVRHVDARTEQRTLEVDVRAGQLAEDRAREDSLRVKTNGSAKGLAAHLNGEPVDLEEIFVFRKGTSVEIGKVVYHRIPSKELASWTKEVHPDASEIYVMKTVPHTSAAGFYEKKSSKDLHTIEPRTPTAHSKYGYEVYLNNGFDPVGSAELAPYETTLSIRATATYDTHGVVSIGETDGPQLLCPGVQMDTNARIIHTLKTGPWFESWVKAILATAGKDAGEIETNELAAEVARLRAMREIACILKSPTDTSARFTLPGTYESNRLFNQGTFITMEEALKTRSPKAAPASGDDE